MVRMNVSQFRLLIAEIDKPTDVVNRGKVIGTYTPTVRNAPIQGDAIPDLVKENRRGKKVETILEDLNKETW